MNISDPTDEDNDNNGNAPLFTDTPLYRSNDPQCNDPRFLRRVLWVRRPIPFVENIHEAGLECGHEPLLMGGPDPQVGGVCFCPSCYEARDKQV